MTDLRSTKPTKSYRTLLTRSTAFLGGMGVLSSGMLWAQTAPAPTPVDAPAPAPVAVDLTPVEITPTPSLAVESTPVPPASMAPPAPTPAPSAAPFTPATTTTIAAPVDVQPKPAPGSSYIDPTNYNLGATEYEAPAAIVLTERSTGCQQVLQGGQGVTNAVCAPEVSRSATNWSVRPVPAEPSPTWVNRQAAAIRVGPLSIGSNGTQAGGPSPYAQYYYNQTARPIGVLGNGNIQLLFPLSIPAPITSIFGWRTHPISGDVRFHSGTDLGAPAGTPVVAAYAGRVTAADFLGGYGLSVVLDHNNSTQETLYAHLSEIFVQPGEWVDQGTVIGRVGSTGNSTGPHLHFEFRQLTQDGWVALDPGQQLQLALAQLTNPLQALQGQFKAEQKHSFSVGLTLESVFPIAQVPTPTGQGVQSQLTRPQFVEPVRSEVQSQFNPQAQIPVFGLLPENQAL